MPNTYSLIASNILTSTTASVTFSSIPATFTDLVVRCSVRKATSSITDLRCAVNASTTDGSNTFLEGDGGSVITGRSSSQYVRINNSVTSAAQTANTFSSAEFYFSNYLVNAKKPISGVGVQENESTTAYISPVASLYNQNTAISSLVFSLDSNSFVSGSSFYLYGIKNS